MSFLQQEEHLEGDNQYMCGQCNSKQNATRSIGLRSLPPVLNMQLLRFVFERYCVNDQENKLSFYMSRTHSCSVGTQMALCQASVVFLVQ